MTDTFKSASQCFAERDGRLVMEADEAADPGVVEIRNGERALTYRLIHQSGEQLLAVQKLLVRLSEPEVALERATWISLLSVFLAKDDAERCFREQGIGTISKLLRGMWERRAVAIEKAAKG